MGWRFKWVSSAGTSFNRDYGVAFEPEELGAAAYNYTTQPFPSTEAPGASVFFKDADGAVYHTHSAYQRGLDAFIGAYQLLDIAPKDRDEADLSFAMGRVRLKDEYEK